MLPSDLVKALPEGISEDDIWSHGVIRAGLEGSTGETHLALIGDLDSQGAHLLLLVRATTMTPARCEPLALKPPPSLEVGSFSASWRLHTAAGRRYDVAIPGADVSGVLDLLAQLYEARGDGPEAINALTQRLSLTRSATARLPLLERIATLHEALGAWGHALGCWVEVLALDSYQPDQARVDSATALYLRYPDQTRGHGQPLAAALLRAERLDAASQTLRAMVERADGAPAEITLALLRLIEVCRKRQDHPGTLWALTAALRAASANDARRLLEDIDDLGKLPPPMPAEVARALLSIAADPGPAPDAKPRDPLRLDALRRLERLSLDALRDPRLALTALAQQLPLIPDRDRDPLLRKRLDLLASIPDWPLWLDAALAYADEGADYSVKHDLLPRAAEVAEASLKAPDRALAIWQKALDYDPTHRAALDAICRLTATLHDWPAALAARERLLTLTFDLTDACASLQEMARLAQRHLPHALDPAIPNQPLFISYWRRVLDINPSQGDALRALDAHYAASHRWGDLMDTLQRQIWAAQSDPSQADALSALLRRLASLWQTHLANPRQALDTWQRVLALHPHDVQVLLCVRDLAAQIDDLDTLERTLRALRDADLNPAQHIDVRFALVHLLIDRLGDRDAEAINIAWDILRRDPQRVAALDIIEARARAHDDFLNVARALEHRRAHSPPSAQDPIDRALGHLYAAHLSRHADAIAAYTRAWDRSPGDDALFQALRALYRAIDQADALIALKLRYADHLDALSPSVPPPWFTANTLPNQVTAHDAADHLRAEASLRAEQRGDLNQALTLRLSLLPRRWADNAFLDATIRCAVAADRAWDATEALIQHRAHMLNISADSPLLQRFDTLLDDQLSTLLLRERERGRAPSPALLFRIGQHYAQDRNDLKAAARSFALALDANPDHGAAFTSLCSAYKSLSAWPDLSLTLRRRVATLDAALKAKPSDKAPRSAEKISAERASLIERLIRLHTDSLPDPDRVADLRRALKPAFGRVALILFVLILLIALGVAAALLLG